MNTPPRQISLPVAFGGCLAAVALGWFLRGALAGDDATASTRRGLVQQIAQTAPPDGRTKKAAAGGGFAHLQAVAEKMITAGPAARLPASGSLASEEAEALARELQGETLAAHAADNPDAFLTDLARRDYRVRVAALTAWAERDPEKAFQAVLASRRITPPDAAEVFTIMARHDLTKARTMLESASTIPGPRLDAAWTSVFKIWAEQDLAGLQEKLPALGARAGMASNELAEALAKKDPAAAAAWARSLPDKTMIGHARTRIMETLTETNPQAAAEYMEIDPNYNTWNLGSRWSDRDPEGALRWLTTHPDSKLHEVICTYSLTSVASTDPAAAQAFLATLPAQKRSVAIGNIASGMAGTDSAAALQWASSLSDETERRTALAQIATGNRDESLAPKIAALAPEAAPMMYFKTDVAAAARSLATLPPDQQKKAWAWLYSSTSMDPSNAAVLVDALPEGEMRTTAAINIASSWSASDPAAAAAWVARLPEGDSRSWAVENLVANWGRYDPGGAQKWTEALAAGVARDKALAKLKELTSPKRAGK